MKRNKLQLLIPIWWVFIAKDYQFLRGWNWKGLLFFIYHLTIQTLLTILFIKCI